ncbi:transcriptional regulator [Ferrigenium kumadai]|uniref:Transcriptional regulator n=1 Tax=Ferrigenium kumadai TaxID=1682490 RepID=A0AAN1SX77_9PROT|nr:TfoX/Sxy family protein [Ferrigenium kumadai]BBI98515.1 transcriptional regulator [Ferrigenium kumadai]
MSAARNEFAEYVVELMAGWAAVSARRMFGGFGLYREGLMFALIAEDQLYFKTDAHNVAQFERAGSRPFVYESKVRTVQMSYWSAPEACLESPAEMREWCQSAYAAALRAHAAKPVKRTGRKAT